MAVSAKRVRVSDDSGTTWFTLPGNQASVTRDAAKVDDTIFGQNFKSEQPTLIDGKIAANAFYRGYAGYVATVKKSGSTTATTAEATTLVSGKTYRITNAVKQLMDRNVAVVVKDNAVDHTADVLSIDYLFGLVTFKSAYTVLGPVTLDYSYLPLAAVAKARSFSLTQQAAAVENSDFPTMQGNSGHRTYISGLKTISAEIKGFFAVANGFEALLDGRAELIIEINPDGLGITGSVARGFFRPGSDNLAGNVGAIEDYTLMLSLTVPQSDLLTLPFSWQHGASTTMATAVQKMLTAFINGTNLAVQYLPDGTTGFEADACVVTNVSLVNAVDGISTFTADFQISGVISAV